MIAQDQQNIQVVLLEFISMVVFLKQPKIKAIKLVTEIYQIGVEIHKALHYPFDKKFI